MKKIPLKAGFFYSINLIVAITIFVATKPSKMYRALDLPFLIKGGNLFG
jgi:hypothetical protein